MKKILLVLAFLCAAAYANAQPQTFTVTKTGVGPVQTGVIVKQLPAAVQGLYDTIKVEQIEEEDMGDVYTYEVLHFMLDGKPVIIAQPYDGKIGSLRIVAPHIRTDKGITAGSGLKKALDAGGKVEVWNDGSMYLEINGVSFEIPSQALSKSGGEKNQRIYMTGNDEVFNASDFNADAKIGNMVL